MSKNQKFPAPDTPTLFKLSDFDKKPVEVKFINEQTSHDGGLLLLNKLENQLGLVERLARCINDPKHQGYVLHSIDSMIKQRVMQIAAGYEDVNDCNTMRED
ncbi:MAG: IS1380 family transposase, partial [Bacteroidetes bacterium]|nr:IS1380 family transposase [Bacteroidota bacterium]